MNLFLKVKLNTMNKLLSTTCNGNARIIIMINLLWYVATMLHYLLLNYIPNGWESYGFPWI